MNLYESGHFITCEICGAQIDCRDLSQVFEHEHKGETLHIKTHNSKRVGDNIEYLGGEKPQNLN